MNGEWIKSIGLVASIVLPFWNIPLIAKIIKRRSSADVSLWWAWGVWVCLLLMLPSGLTSPDIVWKTFSITNLTFFSAVVAAAVKYRKGPGHE